MSGGPDEETVPHTIEEKAARLEGRIRAIHAHQDFPVLSDQIREVVRVSEDDDSALDRLAGLVIRNYGLTLKVLRTVNSIHYNRSGQTILSVARAVMLLGVRTVREFCASFLLFDHYQKQSDELKELMLLSMLTATQADALAEWAPGAATEEAYVCGMFRNLGEVLIAHHFPEDYGRIRETARERDIPVSEAVARELGFSYEDLGAAMARYWGMPIVGQAMLPHGTGTTLRAVTEFSHALTDLVYRSPRPPAEEAILALVQRFRREVPVPADRIATVLDQARAEVRRAFAGAGGAEADLDLLTRGAAEPPVEVPAVATDPQALRQVRDQLLGEVAAAERGGLDLHRTILILLEALHRGGPFDRVLFCLVETGREELRARLALGDGAEALMKTFRFATRSDQNPVAACLANREPGFVTDSAASPAEERILKAHGAAEFGVLPLAVEGKAIGCLYCDRRTRGPADFASTVFLGRVQSLAEAALVRHRGG